MRRRLAACLAVCLVSSGACAASKSNSAATPVRTIAGTGDPGYGGDGGPASSARLDNPAGVAVDGNGNLFIADQFNHRVRKVAPNKRISTVAGNGDAGSDGDGGPATAARLHSPAGLAVDGHGNLFIADPDDGRVRKVDAKGTISTVAGNGQRGLAGDGGAARDAILSGPIAVAVDGPGSLLIADADNSRVRRVDPGGRITTVAGGGDRLLDGDTDVATDVDLGRPGGLSVDGRGHIFVSTPGTNRVLRVDGRTMSVIAKGAPTEPETTPTRSYVAMPGALAADGHGDVFVAEADASRVRRISPDGRVFTVATSADLAQPVALALTSSGDVVVADAGQHRVREIDAAATKGIEFTEPPPTIDEVSPATGGNGGQTAVFIRGRGFSTLGMTVTFGGRPARVLSVQDNQVLVTSPPGKAGANADIVVTTPAGASPRSRSARFAYVAAWQLTGALGSGRFEHTMTLLDPPACHAAVPPPGYPCGQVLVAGGYQAQGVPSGAPALESPLLASSELYDPATGKWGATGNLVEGRRKHTATLLDDGRVLAVGGLSANDGDEKSSAELFDPVTGTWSLAANLSEPRVNHAAVLLRDGRVLVAAGGTPYEAPKDTAELYDPATGAWTGAGRLSAGREGPGAAMLADGRVLIAGGGGRFAGLSEASLAPISSTEIFDPGANAFTPTAAMAVARLDATATLLHNGQVLVEGGLASAEPYIHNRSAEIYDAPTATWHPTALLNDARASDTATLLADGRVLVAGGAAWPGEPYLGWAASTSTAEVFDPGTNRWSRTRILNTARQLHAAVRLDGPACRRGAAPAYCGAVLAAGGGGTTTDLSAGGPGPIGLASTELYR